MINEKIKEMEENFKLKSHISLTYTTIDGHVKAEGILC